MLPLLFAKAHASVFFTLSLMFTGVMAQALSVKDTLDSLRSPEQSNFSAQLLQRESITTSASELDDVALNDDDPLPFNTACTTLPSVLSTPKSAYVGLSNEEIEVPGGSGQCNDDRSVDSEKNPETSSLGRSHHKSASVVTIRSGYASSFDESNSFRISLDGQHALQEEFSRLQKEKQALQEQGAEESIDWGTLYPGTWSPRLILGS